MLSYYTIKTVKMSYDAYSSADTCRLVDSAIIDAISAACAYDLNLSRALYEIFSDEPILKNAVALSVNSMGNQIERRGLPWRYTS